MVGWLVGWLLYILFRLALVGCCFEDYFTFCFDLLWLVGCFELEMRLAWLLFDLRVTFRSVSISFGWLVSWVVL